MRGERITNSAGQSTPPLTDDDLNVFDQMFRAMPGLTLASRRRQVPWGAGADPPNPFAELLRFAKWELKGKERAAIEAICAAGGELPIADLAVTEGVDWADPASGFKGVQRRLNPKLKKVGFQLVRHDNAARLVPIGVPKRG